MVKSFRSIVRNWLPPAITQRISRLNASGSRFEGNFNVWRDAESVCLGYHSQEILDKVLAASLKVKNGEAAYERDSVTFDEIDYSWPLLSGLMWAGACNSGNLNVLDFGGALGSSYFQNREYLNALPQVKWNIVEQAHYVQAGRQHIQNEQLQFYQSIGECLVENQPNVILLSSVLQYIEAPFDLVEELSSIDAACLIIDRTPFSSSPQDRILVQKVPPSIYTASYPMWAFSLQKFLHSTNSNWNTVSRHLSPEGDVITSDGFGFSFQGMLLEVRK